MPAADPIFDGMVAVDGGGEVDGEVGSSREGRSPLYSAGNWLDSLR